MYMVVLVFRGVGDVFKVVEIELEIFINWFFYFLFYFVVIGCFVLL